MLYQDGRLAESETEWLEAKLSAVHWDIKRSVAKVLDSSRGSWRDLVAVLPTWLIDHIPVLQLENVDRPSWDLLQILEQWDVTVSRLISCLEALELENALQIIKPDVELEIVEEVVSSVEIEEGESLQLTCRATGFPTPQYQWYKDDQELIEHLLPRLVLTNARYEDAGKYYCKVYNFDRVTEEERFNHVLSKRCQVDVVPPVLPPELPTIGRPPEIDFQPRVPSDPLPQGCSLTLECRATGDEPITYQWFKDRVQLKGETGSELHLRHLMPDERTEVNSWQYLCEITNPHGKVISNPVTISLGSSQRDTLFTARDKVALLIANETYEKMESFILPSSDVATLSEILRKLNFRVMSYVDLKRTEMINAVHQFCSELSKGSYGLFYFAGHGFEIQGQSYMQPIDASELYADEENVCVDFVASMMQNSEPALNLFILDMCRERPVYSDLQLMRKQRQDQKKKYNNVFFAYATSFLGEAVEVEGYPNGLFVHYLKDHLAEKKPLWDMFSEVNRRMSSDRLAKSEGQVPSLEFNISQPITLRDPVLHPSENKFLNDQKWQAIYKPPHTNTIELGQSRFVLKFSMHKNTFCNALDVVARFQVPSQHHRAAIVFSPDCIRAVNRKSTEPGFLKYTLKGLHALQVPVEYQIILKTASETLQSKKYSFRLSELMSLDLNRNVL